MIRIHSANSRVVAAGAAETDLRLTPNERNFEFDISIGNATRIQLSGAEHFGARSRAHIAGLGAAIAPASSSREPGGFGRRRSAGSPAHLA